MKVTFNIPDEEILLALDAVADGIGSSSARKDADVLKVAFSCIGSMEVNADYFDMNSEKKKDLKCLIIAVAISETAKHWNDLVNSMLTKE